MNRLAARIGMWASIFQTFFTLVYVVGLVITMTIVFSQHSVAEMAAQRWTTMEEYAAHYADNPLSMMVGLVVQADVFLNGISILIIYLALHELTDPSKRILTRIASAFALALLVISCTTYYIQFVSVHQTIMQGGDLDGLAQFVEGNWFSPAMATLQLSWTILYGLTTLVAAWVFTGRGLETWIKWAFIVNGVVGLLVGIAYALGNTMILPLSILTQIVISFAYPMLAILFHRAGRGAALSLAAPYL